MATAPRTISQRIALEGADEIIRQLNRIGNVGEEELKKVEAAALVAGQRLAQFVGVVANVERAMAGVAQAGRAFGQNLASAGAAFAAFESSVTRFVRNVALIAGGGGLLGAAGVGLVKFATSAAQAADALGENAAAAGLSVESFQKFQFAAQQSGVSASQFAQGMARLNEQFESAEGDQLKQLIKNIAELRSRGVVATGDLVKLQEAARGTGESAQIAKEGLAQFGIQVRQTVAPLRGAIQAVEGSKNAFLRFGIDVSKSTPEEAILKLGDALGRLPNETAKAAAGVELFGLRTGPKFVQFLINARESLRGFEDEFKQISLTEAQTKLGDRTANALDLLGVVAQKARVQLGLIFAPTLERAANSFTQAILRNFGAIEQQVKSLERSITPFIDAIGMRLRGEGDDDNQALQTIFKLEQGVRSFGESVKNVFTVIIPAAFRVVMDALNGVARAFNSLFGTNLTGAELGILIVLGKITGAFALIAAGARLAFNAVRLLFSAFSVVAPVLLLLGRLALLLGPGGIAAGIGAAALLIVSNFETIRKAAFDTWQAIRDKWAESPIRKAITAEGSAADQAFRTDAERDAEIARVQADQANEVVRQRARLNEETRRSIESLIQAEQGLAQATTQTTQAVAQAVQATQAQAATVDAAASAFKRGDNALDGFAEAMQAQRGGGTPAIVQNVDSLVQSGQALVTIGGRFNRTVGEINQGVRDLATPIQFRTFDELPVRANAAATQVRSTLQQLGTDISTAIQGGQPAIATAPATGAAPAPATGGAQFSFLVESARSAAAQILEVFRQLGPQLGPVFSTSGQAITDAILAGLQGLLPALSSTFQQIPLVFQGAITNIQGAVQAMLSVVQQASQQAIQALQEVVRAAQEAAAAAQAVGGRTFAVGGYTGAGPASKPAGVVHKGEYVQPAWVVRKPGVLGAMEWLRRTGDLPGLIERFTRGFDVGGLVGSVNLSPKLAYAGGGMVSGSRNFGTLTLAGASGQAFQVMTDADTAGALFRYANLRNSVSGGRKPQRWGR